MTDGHAGIHGGATSPAAPSRDILKALAAEPVPSAPSWTRVGRGLQKHGYRLGGSAYPRVTGPPAHDNAVARQIVEAIVDAPTSVIKMRPKMRHGQPLPFLEVVASDGRKLGYRWEPIAQRFVFEGFREP